jgi:hypothetical protein
MTFQQYPGAPAGIPQGNTAQRPASPVQGTVFYNGQLGLLEIYDGVNWVPCSAPAGIPSIVVTDVGTSRPFTSAAIAFTITPGTNGGSPYGYTAVATSGTPTTYTTGATASTTPTLSVGSSGSYAASASAFNGFGTSPSTTTQTVTVTTVPGTPTIGAAANKFTNQEVTVAFTAPATGGKSITNYKYSIDGGSTYTALSPAQTTSPLTIGGLTNNTAYTFSIKAVNANGDSAASGTSNSTTPTVQC